MMRSVDSEAAAKSSRAVISVQPFTSASILVT
jgi:hypothetical protein